MRMFKQFPALVLAVVFGTLAGCAASETGQSTGAYIDDAALTAKVKTALIRDDSLNANDINVETYNGTVNLSGFVDSRDDVREAEELAADVAGVVDVTNDLRVKSDY